MEDDEETDYLEQLNEEQRQAVERTEGALLLLAPAGTGKTKTLVTRVAHIINCGLATDDEIFCVTFTNRAANEMKSRLEKILGGYKATLPWVGTFHYLGLKLLKMYYSKAGLRAGFTILEGDQSVKVIKGLLEEEFKDKNIDVTKTLAKSCYKRIRMLKNAFSDAEQSSQYIFENFFRDFASANEDIALNISDEDYAEYGRNIYKNYQAYLVKNNYCDLDDLVILPVKILQDNPKLAQYYKQHFRYILVDEYQDINLAQYMMLKTLTANKENPNICCIGDDDQAIYSWRGSTSEFILQFERDFPAATKIKIPVNYRSTPAILEAANKLIKNNNNRHEKELKPHIASPRGSDIIKFRCSSDDQQNTRIIDIINQLKQKKVPLHEIAILTRLKNQVKQIDALLLAHSIPHNTIGVISALDTKAGKLLKLYLQFVSNISSDLIFYDIINCPPRSIGEKSLKIIEDYAKSRHISLFEASKKMSQNDGLSKKAASSLKKFVELVEFWQEESKSLRASDLTRQIAKDIDFNNYLARLYPDESDYKKQNENYEYFLSFADHFVTLEDFMESISLNDQFISDQKKDFVNILTMHNAKGTEFEAVILPFWKTGSFPFIKPDELKSNNLENLEEERRLAYVAITRAKKYVYILYMDEYSNHIFIDELGHNLQSIVKSKIEHPKPVNNFYPGQIVYHPKFGEGTVESTEGDRVYTSFKTKGTLPVICTFLKSVQ